MNLANVSGILLLSLALGASFLKAEQKETSLKPNILFIMVDDLGFADLGFHGSDIPTPNIDSLANGGVKLESMYTLPLCTPSRAALMTGRYPSRYGLQSFVITPGQHYGLPLDERTLASALKEAGYKTHMLGKWHLGHADKAYWPTNRGFDHFKGNLMGEIDYWTKVRGGFMDWQVDGKVAFEEGYHTDLLTQEAEHAIQNHDTNSSPLFLYLAYLAVHSPYQAKPDALANFTHVEDKARRAYSAMVSSVDQSIGSIVHALEKKGMREDTIIIFSSDNGGVSEYPKFLKLIRGEKPAPARNTPYRGGKTTFYEGGIRVASFANWPGHIPSGLVARQMVHMVDWFPTLLALAGVDASEDQSENHPLDGKNIWKVITDENEASPHEEILINMEAFQSAIRRGNYKLIKHAFKLTELFDIENDPTETTDIAKEFPDIVKELEARLKKYEDESTGSLFFKEYYPQNVMRRLLESVM